MGLHDDDEATGRREDLGLTRRQFLRGVASGAGAVGLGALDPFAGLDARAKVPTPERSGLDHVVVVMMENRSFDHYLGWLPGADGRQAGLSYMDAANVSHPTHPLAPDFQGCGHPDPDHSFAGGRVEYNNGACDGWLRAGANDAYAIGYYEANDLSFFRGSAVDWTTCDHYFSPIMAPTYPNRFYHHAAQTDRLTNSFELSTLPTIWDRLAARGLEGRYYFSDVPFLALWGLKYLPISRPLSAFLTACDSGTLPAVSFVDPRFLDSSSGTSNDDHPHADIRNGQAFLNLIYTAVTQSKAWKRTVLVITYDEWGGFFDHLPPSIAAIPEADRLAATAAGVQSDALLGLRGFRVPTVIVSPFARRSQVDTTLYDHTSILRLIEWRWDLEPLTIRDATANNPADSLDFDAKKNQATPLYAVPPGAIDTFCPPTAAAAALDKWAILQNLARAGGWPV